MLEAAAVRRDEVETEQVALLAQALRAFLTDLGILHPRGSAISDVLMHHMAEADKATTGKPPGKPAPRAAEARAELRTRLTPVETKPQSLLAPGEASEDHASSGDTAEPQTASGLTRS